MVDTNDFFREMTLRICGTLDIDRALADALDYLAKHVPADTMGLGYSDVSSARIHVLARVARAGGRYIWPDDAPEIALAGASLEYVRMGPDRPPLLVVNRPDDQPEELIRIFPQLVSSSAMFLRLDISGEEAGAVLISAEGPDRYTPRHAELLESIREPLTIAMINARRYRELAAHQGPASPKTTAPCPPTSSGRSRRRGGRGRLRAARRDGAGAAGRAFPQPDAPARGDGHGQGGRSRTPSTWHRTHVSAGPMISMQCGAVPETLLDSELFGHERGSVHRERSQRKRGRFERATAARSSSTRSAS